MKKQKMPVIFDYILPLIIVLLIYIIAEEFIYNIAEILGVPAWVVGLLIGSGLLVLIFARKRYIKMRPSPIATLINVGSFGMMLLSFFIFIDDLITYASITVDFGRWEIAFISLVFLIVISLLYYLGRRDRLIKNVTRNI